MGRPKLPPAEKKKGSGRTIYFDKKILKKIDAFCEKEHMTRTAAIELMATTYLENLEMEEACRSYKKMLKDANVFDAGAWVIMQSPAGYFVRDKRAKDSKSNVTKPLSISPEGYYCYEDTLHNRTIYLDITKRLCFYREPYTITENGKEVQKYKRHYLIALPGFGNNKDNGEI